MAVRLAAAEYGEGRPVAILHGLFGAGRNWAGIAKRLAAHHRVIAFDLRNHGVSPWADAMGYAAMAEDVRAAMQERGLGRYALIGHSMGGKAAMVLALTDPGAVERLVVIDIAPIAYPTPFRNYIRAMQALDLGAIGRRRDADAALTGAIRKAPERAFLLQNLVFGDGAPRWQLNLAVLDATLPTIAGFPKPPPGAHYDGPALFIAGANSLAVTADAEPAIRALFPRAAIEWIADAGHWVHAEQPGAFLTLVEPFLAADAD